MNKAIKISAIIAIFGVVIGIPIAMVTQSMIILGIGLSIFGIGFGTMAMLIIWDY